jgi:type III restriction enzyme
MRADEQFKQVYREIIGAGSEPALSNMDPPLVIDGMKAGTAYAKHLYSDDKGVFHHDFGSSWEARAIGTEIARGDVVGWLRNPDRKPWSLCAPRLSGTKWVGIYPDFIIFRQTPTGVIADIVDPHLLFDESAPGRAAALAKFASDHGDSFGRIDLLIYESPEDAKGKRLNLLDEAIRKKVAVVSSHEHLRLIFTDSKASTKTLRDAFA